MKYDKHLDEPLNSDERYLYELNVRLGILIEMFSSFLDVYAKQNEIATTKNVVVEEKLIEEVKKIEEVKEVTPKKKRTPKK